jgi:primosomal protein N''
VSKDKATGVLYYLHSRGDLVSGFIDAAKKLFSAMKAPQERNSVLQARCATLAEQLLEGNDMAAQQKISGAKKLKNREDRT